MKNDWILIIGACGWIGTKLTMALRLQHGQENVIAADIHPRKPGYGHYIQMDTLDDAKMEKVIKECVVTQVYLLAAMLSVKGAKDSPAMSGSFFRFVTHCLLNKAYVIGIILLILFSQSKMLALSKQMIIIQKTVRCLILQCEFGE